MISYAVCKNKLYTVKSNGLFKFWEEIPGITIRTTENLGFEWEGGKISWSLWCQIGSFMRWSQETHKQEAHCTLFYNTETKEWRAWAFPQQPNGMTVNLLEDDPDYKTQRRQFGANWIMAGSVHHHCNSAAFQSGTDSKDEIDKEGVHITLGNLLGEVSLHIRKVLNNSMITTTMDEFFDAPTWLDLIPKQISKKIEAVAIFANFETVPFDEQWKSNIKLAPTFTTANAPGVGLKKLPGIYPQHGGIAIWPTIEELVKKRKKQRAEKSPESLDGFLLDMTADLGYSLQEIAELYSQTPPTEESRAVNIYVNKAINNMHENNPNIAKMDILNHLLKYKKQ